MRLRYAAISDVGRVRKDNQDSGYAGPWLLTVCDGVGGAARGDLASSTADRSSCASSTTPPDATTCSGPVGRRAPPRPRPDRRARRRGPRRSTAPAPPPPSALFDGDRLGVGPRRRQPRLPASATATISQLTNDHTFVQSLIDEGRITEEEARIHPHRNLILQGARRRPRGRPRPVHRRARPRRPDPAVQRRRLRRARRRPARRHPRAPGRPTTPPSSWSAPASRPAAPTTSPASSPTSSTRRTARRRARRARSWSAPPPSCARRRPRRQVQPLPRPPRRRHRRARAGAPPRSPTTCRSRSRATRSTPRQLRYAPRAAAPLRLAAPAAGRSPVVLGVVWIGRAAAWSLEPAAVLRRRAGRHGRDLPRRPGRPPGRRPLARPTRRTNVAASTGSRRLRRAARSQRGHRAPASLDDAAARPSQQPRADASPRHRHAGAGSTWPSGTTQRRRSRRPHGVRPPAPPGRRAVPAHPRLVVGIGAYAAVGLGVEGEVPADIVGVRRLAGRADRRLPTSWSGSSRRTPTRCCCRSWPRSTASAWR